MTTTDLAEGQQITLTPVSLNIDGGSTNEYVIDTIQHDHERLTLLVRQTKIAAVARSLEMFRVILDQQGNATLEIYLAGSNWIHIWDASDTALDHIIGVSDTPDLDTLTYLLGQAHKVLT